MPFREDVVHKGACGASITSSAPLNSALKLEALGLALALDLVARTVARFGRRPLLRIPISLSLWPKMKFLWHFHHKKQKASSRAPTFPKQECSGIVALRLLLKATFLLSAWLTRRLSHTICPFSRVLWGSGPQGHYNRSN